MAIKQLSIITSIYDQDDHEYKIADYITKNILKIHKLRASEIIEEAHVSKAAFYRFLKQLGFSNYVSLQQSIISDIKLFTLWPVEFCKEYKFIELLEGKKRVIVVGDTNFCACLLPYKQLYLNNGIDLSIPMNCLSPYDNLLKYDLNEEDIVFYVSIAQSNYDLLVDPEGKYMNAINHLKQNNIPYIYVGKALEIKEYEKYYIKINEPTFNDCIHKLCYYFEGMIGSFKK